MPHERFVRIAVDAPLLNALTYKTTEDWPAGTSVIVPLGRRKAKAVILGEGVNSSEFEIKSIESLNKDRRSPVVAQNFAA